MAFTRAYEENEVAPELRRIYADVRASFDLPFVPTIFKICASVPEYLKVIWSDLDEVARSREFLTASLALEEFIHGHAMDCGWRMSDQRKTLSGQKFSSHDVEVLAGAIATFNKALAQMMLFSRLLQLGYSGGQRGKVNSARPVALLARMITLHVPNEREAGLRAWLIYSDIKKTTGAKSVLSLFRVLSPFPGYMASVWVDAKKVMQERSFLRARDEIAQRARALLNGIPVGDHRKLARGVSAKQWSEIEETIDGFVRLLPQFALFSATWMRSFPAAGGRSRAA